MGGGGSHPTTIVNKNTNFIPIVSQNGTYTDNDLLLNLLQQPVGVQQLNFFSGITAFVHKAENTLKTDFANVSGHLKTEMQNFESHASAAEKLWL